MNEAISRPVDEADVALLDAVHANPRASFELLGETLGITAVTAARRWRRLTESGRAWVSSVPGPHLAMAGAVFEIEAHPGLAAQVGRALAGLPQVVSVYLTSGEFDVHALVFAGDMAALSALLLEEIPRVPGAARVRSHVGLEWYGGARWRLGAISTGQRASVASDEPGTQGPAIERTRVFDDAERDLYLALQHDGRAGYRELARELNTSEQQVRRRLVSMVRRGTLSFRADFARGEGGWPVELVLWLAAPFDRLEQIGVELGRWPETRICMATSGSANLLVMVQLHLLQDLGHVLARLHAAHPDVQVRDQRVVLRAVKSWGRLLDGAGHAAEVVPVNPWAAPKADFPKSAGAERR